MELRGFSIILSESEFRSFSKKLPRHGVAMLKVGGAHVPVSRRGVRVFSLGDGRFLVEPNGKFEILWRAALGIGSPRMHTTPMAKAIRGLEVTGIYGPGVSLPLSYRQGAKSGEFRPHSPAWDYVRAADSVGIADRIIVAEVGIPRHMLQRLSDRFALSADVFAAAACAGDVLLVLRRMPLTDPVTGFIIVKPVVIDSPEVAGDVLYLPPDIPIALYGDEDGDRYYIDLVAARLQGASYHPAQPRRLSVGPVRFASPDWARTPETCVKHTGLHGVAALAGVLATQGVAPLFNIMYKVSSVIKLAGYPREAMLVLSALSRVLEPLFDARKRLVSPRVMKVNGEQVPGYSLPYVEGIIKAMMSSRLSQAAYHFQRLAEALLSDEDEDAKATGKVVREAVEVINSLPEDVRELPMDPQAFSTMAPVDAMAFSSSRVLINERLLDPTTLMGDYEEFRPRSVRGWWDYSDRQLRHLVGAGAVLRLPWKEDEDGNVTPWEISPRALKALGEVSDDLMVAVLLDAEQLPPLNKQDADDFEDHFLADVVLTPADMDYVHRDWEILKFNEIPGYEGALVDERPNGVSAFFPVYVEEGEEIKFVEGIPLRAAGDILRADTGSVMSDARVRTDRRLFKMAVGRKEVDGTTWYRFHLFMLVAEKRRGVSVTGRTFVKVRYRLASLFASPWFDVAPEAIVSGCHIRWSDSDRVEWLPGRFDSVVVNLDGDGNLHVGQRYLTPQAAMVAAMLAGVFWRAMGVSGDPETLYDAVFRRDRAKFAPGAEAATRIQRGVRQAVRRLASQALEIRNDRAESTARRILVFGELVKDSLVFAGVEPHPDVALHRFDKLVQAVLRRLFGSGRWYPRKGGQNRVIALDLADASAWSDLLAYGGQEWYRFVRETPAIKAVTSSVHGCAGVVQEMVIAFTEGLGWIQPSDGSSSSETAYVASSSLDYVEVEKSQLVRVLDGTDAPLALVMERLQELRASGFGFLRGKDGGLVPIESAIELGLESSGAAFRLYEFSLTSDAVQNNLQFWAVSHSRPAGAKIVLLDGMVKSFAAVVEDGFYTEDGTPIDAVFSAISLKKKQAWGLLLNGYARMTGRDQVIDEIWAEYRRLIASGATETEAMKAAFEVAFNGGIEIRPVKVFKDGVCVGEALVVRVKAVFVDDTALRDDDPDEAGFNGTVLFSAGLVGVPYDVRRFVDASSAVELSRAIFAVRGFIQLPVIDLTDDGDDGGDGDGGDGAPSPDLPSGPGEVSLLTDSSGQLAFDFGVEQESDSAGSAPASDSAMALVVGTREPSEPMVQACKDMVTSLVNQGVTILSGGADGIDTIAVSAAVAQGGKARVILPWSRSYVVEGQGTCDISVQVLEGQYAAEKRKVVMDVHPAPHRLSEGAVKLHMRNVEMLDIIRRHGGVVYAIPSWWNGEYTGGTAMAIRLCELYRVRCMVYHPEKGWYWHVR